MLKVDEKDRSANPEECTVCINRVDVVVYILEVPFKTKGHHAMDILMGRIGNIEADASADFLQNKTVFSALVFIFSLKTTELNADSFSDLQRKSPFFICLIRQILL